jgi:hypothetical protein
VRVLARALDPISPEEVAGRVDLERFNAEGIYPGNWQRNGVGAAEVAANYRLMRDLIARTAQQGLGLVIYIN